MHICHTEFHLNGLIEVKIHVGPWVTCVVRGVSFTALNADFEFRVVHKSAKKCPDKMDRNSLT